MKKRVKIIFLSLIIIILSIMLVNADNSMKKLSYSKTKLVYESVYEVVIKKPFDNPYTKEKKEKEGRKDEIRLDPLVYEEELPWDVLPYTFRIDEYYSIGTAFAISNDTFLSAAHVFNLDRKMLWDDLYLRDKDGNIYEIDKILKYSNHRDFVLFTAKNLKSSKYMNINKSYSLNSTVFAVGNAFGEGIVIRNGLLNSETKETEEGEWDYLRFSAAASPGNSGGPLLNEKGDIIGIVLRKSEDENLNYALPISEVLNAKDNTAVFHKFGSYLLLITSKKYGPEKYDKEIKLPMDYKELREIMVNIEFERCKEMLRNLNEKYKDTLFPNGEGSYNLFHRSYNVFFPEMAAENEDDGVWSTYYPKEIKESQLENNGLLRYGAMANLLVYNYKRPDDVALKNIYDDSKYFMDSFLKGYPLTRNFGNKSIRILSLGDACERYVHEDRYGRKWIVEKWLLEFGNSKILSFSLPTPEGRCGIMFIDDINDIDLYYVIDSYEYINYIYYSYYGTFKQWDEFFKNQKYLPKLFENYKFSYSNDNIVLNSNRFNVSYNNDLFKISDDSFMVLKTYHYKDKEKVVWDITGATFWEDKNDNNFFTVIRSTQPEKSLPEDYHNYWSDMIENKYPYNCEPYTDSGDTCISYLQKDYINIDLEKRKKLDVIYTISVIMEGKIDNAVIKNKFDLANDAVTIVE